ncbi:hypothetical protein SD960_11370 [Flavobacterium sp. MMLR14_040]|jgi:hypothetical protein|uniref:hypothetical protein n=1 Tax=Flavobacterium sp. MMLR14_040 TaxID=3093843 RepID=UPI00298F7B4E|nr:hypothetical protein [Flavobacterium sp. MMLR14_040]MDW8850696.1 hypothetical protein [Flavobacterium sp. MMLR14_040]
MTKKMFVYDSQHGFSRFINKEFGKDFQFEILKKITDDTVLLNMKEHYLLIFFVVYSEKDLFDFLKIYNQDVPIAVCSFKKEILDKFNFNNDFMLLDISALKSEWINKVRMVLNNCS